MSSFDEFEFIKIVIKVSTNSLYIGSYSNTQQWLFERVRSLREDQKLTFAVIAEKLTKFGLRSARGAQLAAEHVFSIYKKGKRRQARLIADAHIELEDVSLRVHAADH